MWLCEVLLVVQVNAAGTCALYHTIGKMAGVGPNSLLLDVCCGTGTIGLTLAKQVRVAVLVGRMCACVCVVGCTRVQRMH